jgi:hypothetical protein
VINAGLCRRRFDPSQRSHMHLHPSSVGAKRLKVMRWPMNCWLFSDIVLQPGPISASAAWCVM